MLIIPHIGEVPQAQPPSAACERLKGPCAPALHIGTHQQSTCEAPHGVNGHGQVRQAHDAGCGRVQDWALRRVPSASSEATAPAAHMPCVQQSTGVLLADGCHGDASHDGHGAGGQGCLTRVVPDIMPAAVAQDARAALTPAVQRAVVEGGTRRQLPRSDVPGGAGQLHEGDVFQRLLHADVVDAAVAQAALASEEVELVAACPEALDPSMWTGDGTCVRISDADHFGAQCHWHELDTRGVRWPTARVMHTLPRSPRLR